MTKKQSTKKGGTKGKAEADALTADRVRDILADPKTSERVKDKLRRAVSNLAEWINPSIATTPEFYAQQFEDSAINLHHASTDLFFARKAAPYYSRAVALAEKHDPKDARLVRRLSAMLRDRETSVETVNRIGGVLCDLSNETRVGDLHPDIFDTLARVLIREARTLAAEKVGDSETARREWLKRHRRGRRALSARPWMVKKYLRELEAIAAEKGGE